MTRGLLDTSVLIAIDEAGSREIPDSSGISVISLGELRAGVILARDETSRSLRENRLAFVRRTFELLPVDGHVAHHFGEALAWARSKRRLSKGSDLLIIATAAAGDLELVTLDSTQAAIARGVGVSVVNP
ncbi:MAG: PIN domain-containing protein [Solirubrobacterales bacterium]